MNIPKQTILKALAVGLKSGSITIDDLKPLLPKRKTSAQSLSVDKSYHVAARRLTTKHGLSADGLRFSVQRSSARHILHLLIAEGPDRGKVAAKGISETVKDLDDLPRACDVVMTRYLESLVA